MLGATITALIIMSIFYSIFFGDARGLSNAALTGCGDAVSLCIYLCGTMALWGGIMRVAEKCGITRGLAKLLRRPLGLLFKDLGDEKTMELIALNVTANLLGLGNAATPIGIRAMKRLCKAPQDAAKNARNTAMFVLLNTASIQLIPITVSSMRMAHGAADPWDCALPTLLTSLASVAAGTVMISLLFAERRKENANGSADTFNNRGGVRDRACQKGRYTRSLYRGGARESHDRV